MTILDKMISAVTPPETDAMRAKAREEAASLGTRTPWLASVVEHHRGIEQAFLAVRHGPDATARRKAQVALAELLTAHSVAEEAVLYPAMALSSQKAHAAEAYVEQSAAKIQMAALETLDPMSEDYLDKLGHIEGAVQHHIYREESSWFPKLVDDQPDLVHARLAERYEEEYGRYRGRDSIMPEAAIRS